MNKSDQIKDKARKLGFDLVGIAKAYPLDDREIQHFKHWLKSDYHADMKYMKRNLEKRTDPGKLLKGAKSVIVTALAYKTGQNTQMGSNEGYVAEYARYEDYHHFMKQKLYLLAEFIEENFASELKFKVCVDSVPIAERAFAVRAGLGFIGKNHMLINQRFGPAVFLGELVSNLDLEADSPVKDNCRDCQICINSCPTGALRPDAFLDCRKCISYLTIEHKGQIDQKIKKTIGNNIFGCDECVVNCPMYKKADPCHNSDLKVRSDLKKLALEEISEMNERDFMIKFTNTSLERLGLEKLRQNAQVCLHNLKRVKK